MAGYLPLSVDRRLEAARRHVCWPVTRLPKMLSHPTHGHFPGLMARELLISQQTQAGASSGSSAPRFPLQLRIIVFPSITQADL